MRRKNIITQKPPEVEEKPKAAIRPKTGVPPYVIKASICVGILLGLLLSFTVIQFLIKSEKLLIPQCPKVLGRQCNSRGYCEKGVCICDSLYSGPSCADTEVPGYLEASNLECNGKGFALPLKTIPEICKETVVNGVRKGNGWGSSECHTYVESVRLKLLEADNNPQGVKGIFSIPSCTCENGFGGLKCEQTGCPINENGLICSGNGNTSVGIFNNYTNAGEGCQCSNLFAFYETKYSSIFSTETKNILLNDYYTAFNKRYCGHVVQEKDKNGQPILDSVFSYTLESDYKCYCDSDWKGRVCNLGKCPMNKQTNEICSGHGHPEKGKGILKNTTSSRNNKKKCNIICKEGFSRCKDKCYPDINEYDAIKYSKFCDSNLRCNKKNPIRCPDGSCVPFPKNQNNLCSHGFTSGSIDYTQLDLLIERVKCENITNTETFELCFRNTTTFEEIDSYLPENGFVFQDGFSLTFNLNSPLIYFEMVTNFTNTQVITWDNQVINFNTKGFISGIFKYEDTGEFGDEIEHTMYVEKDEETETFKIGPMPYNYTPTSKLNSNFKKFKISNKETDLSIVLEGKYSNIERKEFDFSETALLRNGVLVSVNYTSLELDQELFYLTSGRLVSLAECLTSISSCAWYLTEDHTTIRNLEMSKFICNTSDSFIAQDSSCATSFLDMTKYLNLIFLWQTVLQVNEKIYTQINNQEFNYYSVSTPQRTEWPVVVNFQSDVWKTVENKTYIDIYDVRNPVFIGRDDTTIACSCDSLGFEKNQSTLNEIWWLEDSYRQIGTTNLKTDDFIVAADYSSGERRLKRGTIKSISTDSDIALIEELNSNNTFSASGADIRKISTFEVYTGVDDCNPTLKPFKCPDGSCTTASVDLYDVPSLCNCTYSKPLVNCECSDEIEYHWGCNCNLNSSVCECGIPATHAFELDLLDKMNNLIDNLCECLIDFSEQTVSNTSVTIENVNEESINLNFEIEQIPVNLAIKLIESECPDVLFTLYSSSLLFEDLSVPIEFIQKETSTCEFLLTLFVDQNEAFSEITIVSNFSMSEVTLYFSSNGYLLTGIENPELSASSNQDEAINILNKNSSSWIPDSNIRKFPIWIQMSFDHYYYIDYTKIIFGQSGKKISDIEIPVRVYIQVTKDLLTWKTLGSWGIYIEENDWFEASLKIDDQNVYRGFRLIALSDTFSVRQWDIYSKSLCTCSDNTHLTLDINSTEGLISISEEMRRLNYLNDNLDPSKSCVFENDCILVNEDVTNNGECNDAIYHANLIRINSSSTIPVDLILDIQELATRNFTTITHRTNINDFDYDTLQFTAENETILTQEEILDLPELFLNFLINPSNESFTMPYIYYLTKGTLDVFTNSTENAEMRWINNTYTFMYDYTSYLIDYLANNGMACKPGYDGNDCGGSSRIPLLMKGYTCYPTEKQIRISDSILNKTTLFYKGFIVDNLNSIQETWNATFQNVNINRRATRIQLDQCDQQVCPLNTPYKCENGDCKATKKECNLRYNCPGNGCIQLQDGSGIDHFRCACNVGYAGDACQFNTCKPSLPESKYTVAGAEECTCGGPPPFREMPPFLNSDDSIMTNADLQILNDLVTVNSAPKSIYDIDYHRILPTHSPFGRVIKRIVVLPLSDTLSKTAQTIYTTCPCLRKGPYGEYILLTDDVLSRNIITKKPTWKVYYNSKTLKWETFAWTKGICTYDELPYRCPNADCVKDKSQCAQSIREKPLCNNLGQCLADGVCDCYGNHRTFAISKEYTDSIKYPYKTINGITDPTAWELNWNWKTSSKLYCTARNCEFGNCPVPYGCFTGTPSLNFQDSYVSCEDQSFAGSRCAISQKHCQAKLNLTMPLLCSGNGILRRKDFTNELYCACGTPISKLQSIESVSEITQLKPNGYGGAACTTYYADLNAPLIWSTWNEKLNEPHRSLITGQILPGIWIKGNIPVGPKPEDSLLWEQCCPGLERPELCDMTPCNTHGVIRCLSPNECLSFNEYSTFIYPCNGHGTARADGTCDCEINTDTGEGYTYDYDKFSIKGCYKKVSCPISKITNKPCNRISQCDNPEEFRYPFPFDKYLEQQWTTAGIGNNDEISTSNKINQLSINADYFDEQVLSALTQLATNVIEAEKSFTGCVCVYPDDTLESKCCMKNNGKDYKYKQNYKKPYLLTVTGNSLLTDNEFWASPVTGTFESITNNQILQFNLSSTENTLISAVRIFSLSQTTDTKVEFLTSSDASYCETTLIKSRTNNYLEWLIGTNLQQAHYCGPLYECVNSKKFPEYNTFCGIRSNAIECKEYKIQACEEDSNNVYWDLDSTEFYQGCDRYGIDSDICTCCKKLTNNPIINDKILKIKFTDVSNLKIGEIRFYGYTDQVLETPDLLKLKLKSECQDESYLLKLLDADGSYFYQYDTTISGVQTQTKKSIENAKLMCESGGGFLATTNSQRQEYVSDIQKICTGKNDQNECWINAKSILPKFEFLERTDIISNICYENGCFDSSSNKIAFSHRLKNNLYKNVISNHASAVVIKNYLDTIAKVYGKPLLPNYDIDSGDYSKLNNLPQEDATILIRLRCEEVPRYIRLIVTTDITKAATNIANGQPTKINNADTFYILYGQIVDLHEYVNKNRYETGYTESQWKSSNCPITTVTTGLSMSASYNIAHGLYLSSTVSGYVIMKYWNNMSLKCLGTGGNNLLITEKKGCFNIDSTVSTGFVFLKKDSWVKPCFTQDTPNSLYVKKTGCVSPDFWKVVFYRNQYDTAYHETYINDQNSNGGTEATEDLTLGINDNPYMPLHIITKNTYLPKTFELNEIVNLIDSKDKRYYFSTATTTNLLSYKDIKEFTDIKKCSDCLVKLSKTFSWDQQAYSTNIWYGDFEGPEILIYLKQSSSKIINLLSSYKTDNGLSIYTYFIASAESHTTKPSPYYKWSLPQCATVTINGLKAVHCDNTLRNYVCQYDWTKYAVVSGHQCDVCFTSTSTSKLPTPGLTCAIDNPMSNATLYPFEHELKVNYLKGTLDIFAQRYNINPTEVSFGNTSVITGFKNAWKLWKESYSSRPFKTSRNTKSDQNWVDMCLNCNWPEDCGSQTDPKTNKVYRFCALRIEYCNIDLVLEQNTILNEKYLPPMLLPVSEEESYTNPTCGPNLKLQEYIKTDRHGSAQTDLYISNNILELTDDYIKIEILNSTTKWFNAGKTNNKYIFEEGVEVSISGSYTLLECSTCTDPILKVFIHPLSPYYEFPDTIISIDVPMVLNQQTTYTVQFTVTSIDSGSITINDIEFPVNTFRGVGFEITGVKKNAVLTLYNPVITDANYRSQCTTREVPQWYEPLPRIESTVPRRECVITEDDEEEFPGVKIGECACDLSSAGKSCDSPSGISKHEHESCRGFGDPNTGVIGPDGNLYTTFSGDEAGTYIWSNTNTDCKTIDIGRSLYTLLLDGAIYDYPSVYIQATPIGQSPIFDIIENVANEHLSYNDIDDICSLNAMFMPYYYTADELTQLIQTTKYTLPVFLAVNTDLSESNSWPWNSLIDDAYMINGQDGEFDAINGNCDLETVCNIINFNNYAYLSISDETGNNFIKDGNTLTTGTTMTGTLTIEEDATLSLDIYIFSCPGAGTGNAITCVGGSCSSTTISSLQCKKTCRCPTRILSITSGYVISEIQIFSSKDSLRSSAYTYYL